MDALSCTPDALTANDLKDELALDAVSQKLRAELSERKRVEDEFHGLTCALEQRLKETNAELAATNAQLRLERKERAENRQEIELLNERLLQQKKAYDIVNEELESFSYAISHDLRAPLRHILGFSYALLEDEGPSLGNSGNSYLDSILRAGRKMDAQVDDLLNLSRVTRQDLHPVDVDLSQLARQCAASLQESAPKRRVLFTIDDKLSARADYALLKIAIGNLFDNAWKFTSDRDVAAIEFGEEQQGNAAVFFLRDNGAGFDMRYADKLFAPFQRMHAEREFEGRGMGLATVQRIVHRHGGRIWADALPDGGATFYFTLSD